MVSTNSSIVKLNTTIPSMRNKKTNTTNKIAQILEPLTQSFITNDDVAKVYQDIFATNSHFTDSCILVRCSREQLYAAVLVYELIHDFRPDTLDQLSMHINEYCPELDFITPDFMHQSDIYFDEICTDDITQIIDNNGNVYNLENIRNNINRSRFNNKLYKLKRQLEKIEISPQNTKHHLADACKEIAIISRTTDFNPIYFEESISHIIYQWIDIFNRYIVDTTFNAEIISCINDVFFSINILLTRNLINIDNNTIGELLRTISHKIQEFLTSSDKIIINTLKYLTLLLINLNKIVTFNNVVSFISDFATSISFTNKITGPQNEFQLVRQQINLSLLNVFSTRLYQIFNNTQNINTRIGLCDRIIYVLEPYNEQFNVPITNHLQEMIEYLFRIDGFCNINIIKCSLLKPNLAKFISNESIINEFNLLVNKQFENHKLSQSEQNELYAITHYAKSIDGIARKLILPIKLPPLRIALRQYENNGNAFHVHNTMYHLTHLRTLLQELLNHYHIPPLFGSIIDSTKGTYEYLLRSINDLYRPSKAKTIAITQAMSLNHSAALTTLNVMYSNINNPICKQFFTDIAYFIAFLSGENVRWNDGYSNLEARINILLLALVDSANAYDNENSMSCLTGTYERIYYAAATLTPPLSIMNQISFMNIDSHNVYLKLQRLLNNTNFIEQVAIKVANTGQIIDINFIREIIIETVIEIDEQSVNDKLTEYTQEYMEDDLPPSILNTHVVSLWTEIRLSLIERLRKNMDAMIESYNDDHENQLGIHAITTRIFEIRGEETKS